MKALFFQKYILLSFIAFFFSLSASAQRWLKVQDTSAFSSWKSFVSEVKDQYAPDARSVYFQVYDDQDKPGSYILETSSTELQSYLDRSNTQKNKALPFTVKLIPNQDLEKQYGIVNLSVANLRSVPGHSEELATQAILGTPVDVLKKQGSYYLIRTPEGYLSWVDSYGITLKTKQEMDDWTQSPRAIFMDDFGHSYTAADRKSQRVSDLVLGNIVQVLEKGDQFWKVKYPDGRTAFVPGNQLQDFSTWKKETSPEADQIIEVAKRMLGVPYLWGGTSIKGVDCSGFTKTSYFMNGVIIPRDASQQVRVGQPLDIMENGDLHLGKALKTLRKGDLIFFSASKGRNPKLPITHVAIYIDQGEFIHAAGIVRINSFDPKAANYDDQSLTIVGARRYLGDEQFIPANSVVSAKGY